jgi:hypothetical protein
MSELGQTATSRNARVTSGLPPIPDIRRRRWHGSIVPSRHKFHILSGCTSQLVCYFAYGMEPDAGHRILNRRCSLSAICSAGPERGDSTTGSRLLLTSDVSVDRKVLHVASASMMNSTSAAGAGAIDLGQGAAGYPFDIASMIGATFGRMRQGRERIHPRCR